VEIHPLVLIVFILGGVQAFGFLGIFLGPVIASVLAVLFDMFREEFSRIERALTVQPATNDAISK
jgi:predicted PurR-regulated permease PerM